MSGQEPSPLWLPRCGICGRITDTRAIDPAAIREAALREAAEIASTLGVYPELNVYGGGPEWYRHGKNISAAILALIDKGK